MSHDPDTRPDPLRGDLYAHLDGPYLLGAVSPEERADYEAHLETCATCRAGVEELKTVLPYLSAADESLLETPVAAPVPPLPDTLLPRLLLTASRARRRRRAVVGTLGALTAACLITVVVLVATMFGPSRGPSRQMTAVAASPVTAEVALQPTAWGTEIDLTCWYRSGASVTVGYSYSIRVQGTDGRTYELGTWRLSPGKPVTFTTGTALSVAQISSIDVTDPYGTRLLTLAT